VSTEVTQRQPAKLPADGGLAARRAVIRWAWRLLRREWRQQLLILTLIVVAVAATFVGAAVATDTPVSSASVLGTAQTAATFNASTPNLNADIATLRHRYSRVDVIDNQVIFVPGSVQSYDLRAQNPAGPYGGPLLSLVSGHYPQGKDQVAVTSTLASQFRLRTGGTWRVGGVTRTVTGIVANPQNTLDEFALVPPGQVTSPDQVTVLFDGHGTPPSFLRAATVSTAQSLASTNAINPQTISLTAATLGMLLIALVGVGGFTVLAQRRLRSIGMLGAQGASDRHIRLVVRANGVVTGVAGAVIGFAVGLLAWLAYRPAVESSSHHQIGVFQLPWLVIIVSMVLAVVATYFAAARPARAIARVPIVAALSGRPPAPRRTRRLSLPAGLILLTVAFLLMGLASGSQNLGALVLALLVLTVAVVLVSPALLGVLARFARPAPVAVRLALRDLARYRARSGAALGAISLSLMIAVIICVVAAGRFGNVLDWAGPNLTSRQLIVYASNQQGPRTGITITPQGQTPSPGPAPAPPPGPGKKKQQAPTSTVPAAQQLATATAQARGIATSLGTRTMVMLESGPTLQHAATGRNWDGQIYVATPQLLQAFGIKQSQVNQDADILTMRPGLSTMSLMQLQYGDLPCMTSARGCPPGPGGPQANTIPCDPGYCLNHPVIQEISALPSGTSAPNTVVTEHAVRQLGLDSTINVQGWLIQTPRPLTSAQIQTAQETAAADGLSIETRNSIPSLTQIIDVATVFGILLALGILGMSVGLVRSETAGDLRTLAATGASSAARRTITAATAGALALAGAVTGLFCAYVGAIGFFRASKIDGLSELGSVPVANLLLILVGMPVIAFAAGWLLAGREPSMMGRRPLE
jgi:putative ABC transport system permease protein